MCGLCLAKFGKGSELRAHRALHRLQTDFRLENSAHDSACELWRLDLPADVRTLEPAFAIIYGKIKDLLQHKIEEKKYFKAGVILTCKFIKVNPEEEEEEEEEEQVEGVNVCHIPFRSTRCVQMHVGVDADAFLHDWMYQTDVLVDEFLHNGSGWILDDVLVCDVQISQCRPLNGSCEYHSVTYVKGEGIVPDLGRINARTDGNKCFYYAVASHFVGEDREKITQFASDHIKQTIPSPVAVKDITKFEKDNEHLDVAVNVVMLDEDDKVFPVRASPRLTAKNSVCLILCHTAECVEGEEEDALVNHYARVKDPSLLFSQKKSSHAANHWSARQHPCFNCMTVWSSTEALKNHAKWCHEKDSQDVRWPEPGSTTSFQRGKELFKMGYIFFFDFETVQKTPEKKCACAASEECKHKSFTEAEHEAFAYSLLMIDRGGDIVEFITYDGLDAAEHFLGTLIELEKKYLKKLAEVTPMVLTAEEERRFHRAKDCHICEQPLLADRVRDHDHITGDFVGPAHNLCNLHRKECMKLVGFAHNFSGYDSHIIIRELPKFPELHKKIKAIPLNTEKVKSLNIGKILLLDSAAFLPASLEKLVDTLKESQHDFPLMRQVWREENLDYLLRKGVYPYTFAKSYERLQNCQKLPPRSCFYNEMSLKTVSMKDWLHAKSVWVKFGCHNMIDYTRLYVETDVVLLAEAFTEFRDMIFEEFQLDCCHFLSLPHMAKSIMLKTTGAEMELISDPEMGQWVRSGIRGGLSYVNTRHVDIEKHQKMTGQKLSAVYLDANNLVSLILGFTCFLILDF